MQIFHNLGGFLILATISVLTPEKFTSIANDTEEY